MSETDPPDGEIDETTPPAEPEETSQASTPPAEASTGEHPHVEPTGGAHAASAPEPGGWAALGQALRPRWNASQALVGVLCVIVGFALVVQLGQNNRDQFSSLRQSDLVRMLDEVTTRSVELEEQVDGLRTTRDELVAGADRRQEAQERAHEQSQTQGILSGRLPAKGPGVRIEIVAGAKNPDAVVMINMIEELRNAGAEVLEVNGIRLVTSSHFTDADGQLRVDGHELSSPIRWTAIGDPATIETALTIHGGVVESLTTMGATTTITPHDSVEITAVLEPADPQYATPSG